MEVQLLSLTLQRTVLLFIMLGGRAVFSIKFKAKEYQLC